MVENLKNFINSVQNKDYTEAKRAFEGTMAEKISAKFENKKIELASQMVGEGTADIMNEQKDDTDQAELNINNVESLYTAAKSAKNSRDFKDTMMSMKGEFPDKKMINWKNVDWDSLYKSITEGTEIAEAKKHSHDFQADMFGGLDAKLSRGDTVDLKGLEVDDMNTSSYKKYMDNELGSAVKNLKAKVDRTGMASLSFEVVDPRKVKSVLQDEGIMD